MIEDHIRYKHYSGINRFCRSSLLVSPKKDIIKICDCRQWSCSRCRQRLAVEQYRRIKKVALNNGLSKFLTITIGSHDNWVGAEDESFKVMSKLWNEFLKRYRRKVERKYNPLPKLTYIAFMRSHMDGVCHFHVLLPDWFDWGIIDHEANNGWGFGFYKLERVDIQRVSAYLSRYFYKQNWELFLPKGARHYSCSQDLKINEEFDKSGFDYCFMKGFIGNNESICYDKLYGWWVEQCGKPPPIWFLYWCYGHIWGTSS